MNEKIDNLQILRGFAASFVALYHICLDLSMKGNKLIFYGEGGTIGVPIFFIISGFVMIYSIEKSGLYNNAPAFLSRRIKRIVPLYWIFTFLFVLTFLSFPSLFKSSHVINIPTLFSSLFFYNPDPILRVGWSLNYEMFFYLLLFVNIMLFKRSYFFSTLTILVLVLPIFNNLYLVYFLSGMLFYKLYKWKTLTTKYNTILMGLLIAVYFSVVKYELVFATLIFLTCLYQPTTSNPIKEKLVYLGEISYSLYLTHFFFIGFSNKLGLLLHINPNVIILISLTFAIIGASFVYAFIEKPITIYLNNYRLTRRKTDNLKA